MSSQVVVTARTKLVAMEMEKSEGSYDLDAGIMGKGNRQGGIRFLMTSVWDKLC